MRVLLIDDDIEEMSILSDLCDAEIHWVGSLTVGRLMIQKMPKNHWDLVICDVMGVSMPGQDYLAEIKRLKHSNIVVSSSLVDAPRGYEGPYVAKEDLVDYIRRQS